MFNLLAYNEVNEQLSNENGNPGPPPRGVTTTTPSLGIELQIQKVARARARVFFQDCVILPVALQRLVYLKRSVFPREDATRSTRSKRNTQRAAHATRTRNTQHAHATRNTHTQHATRKNHPKSPFQGLEPLSQVLNKLGRNKKLNPSLANRVMGRCQTLKK